MKSTQTNSSIAFQGGRLAFLAVMGVLFLGGISDWLYLNAQETSISIAASFVEYLTSYISAFVIAGIELGAAYYFFSRYEIGSGKRLLVFSLGVGVLGFLSYVIAEIFSGLFSLGQSTTVPLLTAIWFELSPVSLDYGNALIILLSLFGLVFMVGTLLKINPLPNVATAFPKGVGVVGGLWTSIITTAAAMVCCGPLPGVIVLTTGISSLYFTRLISLQSLLVLISVPILLASVFLADRRARTGCKLRR